MFVLDGSSSVGESNFVLVKNWVVDVVQALNFDGDNIQVGVIQYSHVYPDRFDVYTNRNTEKETFE